MAADTWIKLRTKLPNDGRLRVVSRTCHASTVTCLGALVTLWCLADAQADKNGVIYGYTAEDVNDLVKLPGFCEALPSEWVDLTGEWVKLPEYQEHNGTTGKSRAQATKRQQKARAVTDVTEASRSQRDTSVTREEKRREDIKAPLSPAGTQAHGDDPPTIVVTDGEGNPITPPASPIAMLSGDQGAQMVTACIALRKMGARQFNTGDEELAAVLLDGFTAEQIVRCAAEKALRAAALLNDPDVRDDLAEVFINGGAQADMGLTAKQHTALRSAISQISVSYVAATLRGRRRDAVEQAQGARAGPMGGKRREQPRSRTVQAFHALDEITDHVTQEATTSSARLADSRDSNWLETAAGPQS